MRAAIRSGADMINDIQALLAPGAVEAVAQSQVGVCLMHMQGKPRSMQDAPAYGDVVAEVSDFLSQRVAAAQAAGIAANRISIDPGFGFGKSLEDNLALLRRLNEFLLPECPVMVGLSRKSMLGLITNRPANGRLVASIAANLIAVGRGARILRVHDVEMMLDALAVLNAVEEWN
jgi:dihydropteroate synthase